MKMGKIRHQMKKDRRHQSNNLRRATNKLYGTLAKNAAMQRAANRKQMAGTRRSRRDAADSLRQSKALFARRLARMHAVAVKVAKKQQHKINKLTGVVTANAIKSAKGRAMLKSMQSANKRDISHAISVAIQKGEQRAIAVEKKMRNINKKNKAALSAKVSTMISSLRKSTSKSIYALDMESKSARAALKKEVLFAVKSAAKKAKANLKKSVQWANGRFAALNTVLARNNRKSVAAQMKSDVATLQARIAAARRSAQSHLASADAASVRRYTAALGQINGALSKAKKESNNRFGKLYSRMAKQRKALDTKMASSVRFLNDKIAERAALADVRFSKTVKNIRAVRASATRAVSFARKQMNTKIVSLTSEIKASESRLKGEISIVSGEVMRDRQAQIRVNRRVNKEMSMIIHTANVRHSQSKRARGKLRAILNANKAAAAQEVAALAKKTRFACAMLRGQMARQRRSAAKALTSATSRLHKKINAATRAQQVVVAGQRAALRGAAAAAKAALKT